MYHQKKKTLETKGHKTVCRTCCIAYNGSIQALPSLRAVAGTSASWAITCGSKPQIIRHFILDGRCTQRSIRRRLSLMSYYLEPILQKEVISSLLGDILSMENTQRSTVTV